MTPEQRERYTRQIVFAGIGEQGQERLIASRVAVVGCGALGSFAAGALARAGVGYLRIIDRDYVEWSNLQRQWLFTEADAREGIPKAVGAQRAIAAINGEIKVEAEVADLTPENALDLLSGVDLILDGTDNFETRYLMNDFAVREQVPWVYAAAVGSYGLTMPVLPARGACLRCVYPEPPQGAQPTCETAGVLNAATAAIAALAAGDAIKILAGRSDELALRLTTLDVWSGETRQLKGVRPRQDCPCCGRREFPYLEGRQRAPISLCGRNAVQIHERRHPVDLAALAAALEPLGKVRRNEFALRFFVDEYEITVFPDGRAIIKGTTEVSVARSLYARYVGA